MEGWGREGEREIEGGWKEREEERERERQRSPEVPSTPHVHLQAWFGARILSRNTSNTPLSMTVLEQSFPTLM